MKLIFTVIPKRTLTLLLTGSVPDQEEYASEQGLSTWPTACKVRPQYCTTDTNKIHVIASETVALILARTPIAYQGT